MKAIFPIRTSVTSFSTSSAHPSGFEYDASDYILSITSQDNSSPTAEVDLSSPGYVAAALSNHSIIQYDSSAGQVVQRIDKAHNGPISEIAFFPLDYYGLGQDRTPAPLVISASQDGTVKVFDFRCTSHTAAITSKLQLPNEQALTVSLGYGGTLAAVGTNKARISFFDLRYSSGNRPSGQWMGNYVDAHTDEVTQVRFQTVTDPNSQSQHKTILATASEDGLLSIHDPSQPSEEAALVSILNIGAPLRKIGFFGPSHEGVYALTGNETMSVWHWDSAQKVSDCAGDSLRELLSNAVSGTSSIASDEGGAVGYLVGCEWRAFPDNGTMTGDVSPALHLVAGNSRGDGYLFRVDASQITPLAQLKGGHKGCIRDFCWSNGKLITGGEDARICEWDISGNLDFAVSAGSGKVRRNREGETSSSRGGVGSGTKERKKFSSPY
ncbi:hypothetical protein ACHAW6_014599 [Cyclotella cf. meneghiniana]